MGRATELNLLYSYELRSYEGSLTACFRCLKCEFLHPPGRNEGLLLGHSFTFVSLQPGCKETILFPMSDLSEKVYCRQSTGEEGMEDAEGCAGTRSTAGKRERMKCATRI